MQHESKYGADRRLGSQLKTGTQMSRRQQQGTLTGRRRNQRSSWRPRVSSAQPSAQLAAHRPTACPAHTSVDPSAPIVWDATVFRHPSRFAASNFRPFVLSANCLLIGNKRVQKVLHWKKSIGKEGWYVWISIMFAIDIPFSSHCHSLPPIADHFCAWK